MDLKTWQVAGYIKDRNGATQFIKTSVQADGIAQARAAALALYDWTGMPVLTET